MGVHVRARGRWPRRGLLGGRPRADEAFARIERVIRSTVDEPLLRHRLRFELSPAGEMLRASVHPLAEDLEFRWNAGEVEAWGKTSTLGAGYHAFVVDLLAEIARAEGVRWAWEDGSPETDQERDFSAVAEEMTRWQRRLAEGVLGLFDQRHEMVMVNMPVGDEMPRGFEGVLTPAGPISREWIAQAARGETPDPADGLFIWSARERNAAYWKRLGEAFMWSEVRWRPPLNEAEQDNCEMALACLERAARLDPALELPRREVEELREILAHDPNLARVPSAIGIGYFRRLVQYRLAGGWSLELPGYYVRFTEEDGATQGFTFGGRTVRFGSFSIADASGPVSAQEIWAGRLQTPPPGRPLVLAGEHRRAWAEGVREADAEALNVFCEVAAPGSLALATISLSDPKDERWALEVCKTISHAPARGPD